jgi:hypothetical protein
MTVQCTKDGIESLMLAVYKLTANKITNLIIYGKEVIYVALVRVTTLPMY